jgi:hypothetical protein
MELKHNVELEQKIADLVIKNWENRIRTDIALTDLLTPRKAYFQRKFPTAPSLKEVLYFLSGKAIEKGLGDLIGYDHPKLEKMKGFGITLISAFLNLLNSSLVGRIYRKLVLNLKNFRTMLTNYLDIVLLMILTKVILLCLPWLRKLTIRTGQNQCLGHTLLNAQKKNVYNIVNCSRSVNYFLKRLSKQTI